MKINQKNYAKIEEKIHISQSKFKLSNKKFRSPDRLDIEIVKEITEIIKIQKKIKNFGGEWEYLNNVKKSDFIKSLKNVEIDKLYFKFANLFKTDASYGLVTPYWKDIKKDVLYKSQVLRDIDSAVEFSGLKNLNEISTKERIGNPHGLLIGKKVVLPDTPRHYYFCKKIKKFLENKKKVSFLEIGGGYGGLINLLSVNNKIDTIYSIDLFEGCLIQYYFLKKNGQKVNFIFNLKDFKKGSINLIPFNLSSNVINGIPKCDLVFNSRSFSEMSKKILNSYLNLINKKIKPEFVYHENSNYLLFPNSERHIEVIGNDFYLLNKFYELKYLNISPFSGGLGRYREFVYKKYKL
tara:strand:+ start:998 stop:2050 length:1053 start_codon:yes stop_codon:yes gene_type:complete